MKKPSNRFLLFINSLFLGLVVLACVSQVREETGVIIEPEVEQGGLSEKLEKLGKQNIVVARGLLVLETPSGTREGEYALTIKGDTMVMDIFSKGLKAGEIVIRDNSATVEPSLNDEYLEYMFAVIIRDSIAWWKIYDYELVTYRDFHVLRNSWKKIYVKTDILTPSRQIFRLMKFRTVEVNYSDDRQFGKETLPSNIKFNYKDYKCNITIGRMDF